MASRQDGPGNHELSSPESAERRTAPSPPSVEPQRKTGPNCGSRTRTVRSTSPRSTVLDAEDRPAVARTPEDPPVRDPGLYALTDHFRTRLEQPGRYVSTQTVSDAIRRGQLRWNQTDGWRFALVDAGIRFVVVVSDTETNSPVVVTGWTEVADREAALDTRRWDPVDVDTIAVRAALSESASTPIPDQIRTRTITRPFVIGEHRLQSDPSDPFVRCVDCGCRFRSKHAITSRDCRGRTGR